jgi:glycyl-tRNA synthetase
MAEPKTNELMEKIVSLCKRRGFIFQSSEIYGGINGFWDYGPLGTELKRNVKDAWWRSMTQERDDIVGLDASIIMHPKIWEASGHTSTFSDPMVDCLLTKKRFRADQIEPQSGVVYSYIGSAHPDDVAMINQNLPFFKNKPDNAQEFIEKVLQDLAVAKNENDVSEIVKKLGGTNYDDTVISFFDTVRVNINREAISILIREGDHPESAVKKAKEFYQQRMLSDVVNVTPIPASFGTQRVENTVLFNSEKGKGFGVELTKPRQFNLMFKTYVGPVESEDNVAYLRPETAQAIFVQFKNVVDSSRVKIPFGICQIGKAFRNEINPRNFTFRSREFEQMELEFFIKPDEVAQKAAASPENPQANWGWSEWHKYWVEERVKWYESIGLERDSLDFYHQPKNELAHYAKATVDILYKFPFGTQELEGIAARGDFDLTQHQKHSGKSMEYFDEEAKAKYVPHVIEPSAGVDRLTLALICHAYREEQVTDEKGKAETRVVMKFHPRIAPVKVGVFPLLKNKPELVKKALAVRDLLRPLMSVFYDEAGAIGRRYRRQDEAGTPFCVTVDFDTLGEKPELLDTVTLRDRDTMQQARVQIADLPALLLGKIR